MRFHDGAVTHDKSLDREISQNKSRTTRLHGCVGYKTETQGHRQQRGGHQREGGGAVKGKRAEPAVTEGDLTLAGRHAMQYTGHVSQKCTLETYIILLTNVTPINLMEKNHWHP